MYMFVLIKKKNNRKQYKKKKQNKKLTKWKNINSNKMVIARAIKGGKGWL